MNDLNPAADRVKIAAVIVTYNRLAMLKECIAAIRNQTHPADEIIAIDNSSTDGTSEWLAAQPDLLHHQKENDGGAGGFYVGIQLAYARGHQWIWCMDDDCIPHPIALEGFAKSKPFIQPSTGLLASLVLWTDGDVHRMNAPWVKPATRLRQRIMPWDSYAEVKSLLVIAADRCVPIKQTSFASVLIHRRAVDAVGLPLRKMFIWHDDAEYTQRILERFPGFLVLDSVATHKTARNAAPDLSQPLKYQYSIRNMIVTLRAEHSSWFMKWGRISGFSLLTFLRVITGKLKPSALYWLAKGLTFDLKPDRVQQSVTSRTPATPGCETPR